MAKKAGFKAGLFLNRIQYKKKMSSIDLEIREILGSNNPLAVLDQWLKEALKIPLSKEPWSMVLSTSSKEKVSSRVVLLKQVHRGKLFFYTNYLSSKGRDIENNPCAAVNLYWPQLNRQICMEGRVQKTSREKSVLYWKTRSRTSQLSQWISRQSQEVSSREKLKELKGFADKKFHNKKIPCPKYWGGYAFHIKKIEFWKNRNHRLHDRFLFEKKDKGWKKQRLFP